MQGIISSEAVAAAAAGAVSAAESASAESAASAAAGAGTGAGADIGFDLLDHLFLGIIDDTGESGGGHDGNRYGRFDFTGGRMLFIALADIEVDDHHRQRDGEKNVADDLHGARDPFATEHAPDLLKRAAGAFIITSGARKAEYVIRDRVRVRIGDNA